MSNRVDRLFENKLREYTVEPSNRAWAQIAETLPKKNNWIVWFRAAAGIAIAGLAVLLWYYTNSSNVEDSRMAQDLKPTEAKKEIMPNLETNKEQQEAKVSREKEPILLAHQEEKQTKKIKESDQKAAKVNNSLVNLEEEQSEKPVEVALDVPIGNNLETILISENSAIENGTTTKNKSIVIVYELKSMKAQENPYELDLTPQKKTGLKKVLEIANEVRTGESPLGGLRQAKEEIFAFNFRKEDKNNNK